MAAKRPRSGKSNKSKRKKPGFPAGRLFLGLLTVAGGLYAGVQAHALYHEGRLLLPVDPPSTGGAAVSSHRSEHETGGGRRGRRVASAARRPAQRVQGERAETPEHPEPELNRPAPPEGASSLPEPGTHAPVPAVEVSRGSGERHEVALTFDAGADWKPVKQILETLSAEGVRCTFFLTGEWASRNPRTARAIAEAGHEIGNHSWNHPAFTKLSDDAIRDQLRRTEAVLEETTGRSSRPYFRPPLGARDARVRQIVGDEGYLTVYWTLDSRDSVDRGITAEQIRERVLAKAEPGSISLMHCGSQASA
ncbi:MAG TPA: polysaccharide deacetylase family protein, partial [Armatimonadota bacterium]|nr:polysaccharide deacetylase family protein [Armatimonadota bacterium]